MKLYLDAMGGDNAPQAPVEGALEALNRFEKLEIILSGPEETVRESFEQVFAEAPEKVRSRVTLRDCPEVIGNDEAPVLAIRRKKNSAMADGMRCLKAGEADAFVSAGSTGAILAGGMFVLGRLRGIERPAVATLLPNGKGFFLLIDSGANVDCKPLYLHQFAMMGSAYMQGVRGVEAPRIGLINNGLEEEKGCALTKETYQLLKADGKLNFIGNVEARDITADRADVLVCDGFVGNTVLKFMEGVSGTLLGIIKKELMASPITKLGALLAKPAFARVKKQMSYSEVGGAPLLGVDGVVIKAHGSSNAHAIACAIAQAIQIWENDVTGKIRAMLPELVTPGEKQ